MLANLGSFSEVCWYNFCTLHELKITNMKKGILLTLITVLFLSFTSAIGQSKGEGGGLKWTRVYTSQGHKLEIPEGWTAEESVRNGVMQLLVVNPNQTIYMAMFFFEGEDTAGNRMQMMVSHNNIDVIESSTDTYGSLKVMSKKGKMTYNKVTYKVLLATADGAGGRFNVVGALWGPGEAFQKHKDKFEQFFSSLD